MTANNNAEALVPTATACNTSVGAPKPEANSNRNNSSTIQLDGPLEVGDTCDVLWRDGVQVLQAMVVERRAAAEDGVGDDEPDVGVDHPHGAGVCGRLDARCGQGRHGGLQPEGEALEPVTLIS